MHFVTRGNADGPLVMLIPGLGVSYEIFCPLIALLHDRYHIVAAQIIDHPEQIAKRIIGIVK